MAPLNSAILKNRSTVTYYFLITSKVGECGRQYTSENSLTQFSQLLFYLLSSKMPPFPLKWGLGPHFCHSPKLSCLPQVLNHCFKPGLNSSHTTLHANTVLPHSHGCCLGPQLLEAMLRCEGSCSVETCTALQCWYHGSVHPVLLNPGVESSIFLCPSSSAFSFGLAAIGCP